MQFTRAEILAGRDQEYPLTPELEVNLGHLLCALNVLGQHYPPAVTVSSGYRPGHYNSAAHGASNSPHLTCQAADLRDPPGPDGHRPLTEWCLANLALLELYGLWMESPASTPTWVHLQVRPIPSGHRVFNP